MQKNDRKYLILAHAFVHAVMMILAGFLLRGTGHHQTVVFLIVALWFSTGLMITYPERVVCEIRWLTGQRRPKE
ncbi:MAG: hypothetical protein AAFX06_00975 [Planctomycetota bacterium]